MSDKTVKGLPIEILCVRDKGWRIGCPKRPNLLLNSKGEWESYRGECMTWPSIEAAAAFLDSVCDKAASEAGGERAEQTEEPYRDQGSEYDLGFNDGWAAAKRRFTRSPEQQQKDAERDKLYTPTHMAGKRKARAALAPAPPRTFTGDGTPLPPGVWEANCQGVCTGYVSRCRSVKGWTYTYVGPVPQEQSDGE